MTSDDLEDLEGTAASQLAAADLDDEPTRVVDLCLAMTDRPPARSRDLPCEARLESQGDEHQVVLRADVPTLRARWLVCHELAELVHLRAGYVGADIEERCNTLGAMLVAPARPFRRAMREHGHRVSMLASIFAIPQSLALLRVGEVSGRPVMLLRRGCSIARGGPFAWPASGELRDALSQGRDAVHPVRLGDVTGPRWGLMARWGW